jgi:hypothetical protein
MKSRLFLACMLATVLSSSAAVAGEATHIWLSNPRGLVTITVDDKGGRIAGPGWEHQFAAEARSLDFEIAPERRLVLRRKGESWVGEYFHPRIGIGPGTHESEAHKMMFTCGAASCPAG